MGYLFTLLISNSEYLKTLCRENNGEKEKNEGRKKGKKEMSEERRRNHVWRDTTLDYTGKEEPKA